MIKNIECFRKNEKFHEEDIADYVFTLSLKENSEFYIHIWYGYMCDIYRDPKVCGDYWGGFTRDLQEYVRTFSEDLVEIENLDEYINDLLLYEDVKFKYEETREVYDLIYDFLCYAKETKQTVLAELD